MDQNTSFLARVDIEKDGQCTVRAEKEVQKTFKYTRVS